MTLHMDENAIKAHATEVAGKAAKRKSRKVWALAAVGTVFAGGAAFAAVQLFGFGSIEQGEANLKDLKVAKAALTGSLVPGATVDGSVEVKNENDFDVKVTGVILQDSSLHGTGANCDKATLSIAGSPTTYPGQGGGSGHLISLASPVTIAKGATVAITAPNVVSQNASAKGLCGVKAKFAVVAQVGN